MTKAEILDRTRDILFDTFGIARERVSSESRLYEDLDIDSIDAVDLVVQFRELTRTRLQPEAFRSVRTVGDVVDAVHAHVHA